MADTVADVWTDARSLLNDPNAIIFTDAALLPYTNRAYRELQINLNKNGIRTSYEVSAIEVVPAGDNPVLTLNDITDMLYPLECKERPTGSTENFNDMKEREWEPERDKYEVLAEWIWREGEIKFRGATQSTDVKVQYIKGLPKLNSDTSVILISDAVNFLGAKVAALASMFIGGNTTRAAALDQQAQSHLDDIILLAVNTRQGITSRRLPFRVFGR